MVVQKNVIELSQITEDDLLLVGAKALNLGLLFQAGFPVPRGVCLTTKFTEWILDSEGELREAAKEKLETLFRETFADQIVAVRSSATHEDSEQTSWAGQYYSSLFIKKPEDFVSAVQRCFESAKGFRVTLYQEAAGLAGVQPVMAILIQEMVEAEVAGVMFTANYLTGCEDEIIVQSTFGVGQPLVAGELTGDIYFLSRKGKVLKEIISPKEFKLTLQGKEKIPQSQQWESSLTRGQLKALAAMGLQVKDFLKGHQDIEWAIAKGKAQILQARPITTLGRRDKNERRSSEAGHRGG